jgi:aldehyde dehydrogenase (NAD+)
MQDILNQLGIRELNGGTATGKEWIETTGKEITSYSPVDGKKIASVISCDHEGY